MRVLILADLHLDMWAGTGRDPLAALCPAAWASVEALIIAGDLTNKPRVRWPLAIRHLSKYIDPEKIHIIPGNHDYYDFQIDRDDRLAENATSQGANFAQKAEVLIGHARFLCCTLWTDFALNGDVALSQAIAREQMNDYRYIRNAGAGFRRIRPYETVQIHQGHRAWLADRLAQDHPGPTFVVTHHSPHPELINDATDELAPAYGSDLTDFIRLHQPQAWLSGHTHFPGEVVVGRTNVRNISLGYPDQVPPGVEAQILRRGLIDLETVKTQ
jgi:Icc-related predicted phosphoesterase